jgi:DNA processing protein
MLHLPEDAYWLALSHSYAETNLSAVLPVYESFGSLSPIWDRPSDLAQFNFDRRTLTELDRIKRYTRLEDYHLVRRHLDERGIKLLKYPDLGYPSQLRRLSTHGYGPPIALFVSGTLTNFERCVSIVGTRVLSPYGHASARSLGRLLAMQGYTVVSGLAKGTDSEAHRGALEAPTGRTIAVTAWMEPIYPSENRPLAEGISQRGCIISEFLHFSFGGIVAKGAFVKRNRITSGLSPCLIVIESDEKGGTAHQVRFAISQGRKVFVLEPPQGNTRAQRGYQLFMKMGATPFKDPATILDYLESGNADRSIKDFISAQNDFGTRLLSKSDLE